VKRPTVPSRPAQRQRAGGYTMIEVLMGLAILAVGASGVIALQKVTVLGVTHGRNVNTATAIAAAHLEALRTDAQRWNSIDDYVTDATLLNEILPATSIGPGAWALPSRAFVNGPWLGIADVSGGANEETVDGPPVAYCTHVRAIPMLYDPASPRDGSGLQAQDALMLRLEVRTFWAKAGREVRAECRDGFVEDMTAALEGGSINVNGVTYTADDYGWVFLASAVRRNFLGGT
jgi:prepilin-type N-terminal cleavage/methylation domain-containing protein